MCVCVRTPRHVADTVVPCPAAVLLQHLALAILAALVDVSVDNEWALLAWVPLLPLLQCAISHAEPDATAHCADCAAVLARLAAAVALLSEVAPAPFRCGAPAHDTLRAFTKLLPHTHPHTQHCGKAARFVRGRPWSAQQSCLVAARAGGTRRWRDAA